MAGHVYSFHPFVLSFEWVIVCNRWSSAYHLLPLLRIKLTTLRMWSQHSTTSLQKSAWTTARQYQCPIYLTLLHIPIPFLDSSPNLNLSNHSLPGHQPHKMGLFTLGARCSPGWGSNPWTSTCEANTLPCAIKDGLYCKAVQVCYIPNTTTVVPRYNDHLYNGNFDFRRNFFGNRSFLVKVYYNGIRTILHRRWFPATKCIF